MITNTGTYIDCPFHRFEHGKDLSKVALEQFADLEAIMDKLPESGYRFNAVPPKFKGAGTFPARAYARLSAS